MHLLTDCSLAAFIRPYLTERIPVVSLPVSTGQLIHPGAHLTISGIYFVFQKYYRKRLISLTC
jgi:hypothetical protein